MSRCAKIVTIVFLIIAFSICLSRLINILWVSVSYDTISDLDFWLNEVQLNDFKKVFGDAGGCNCFTITFIIISIIVELVFYTLTPNFYVIRIFISNFIIRLPHISIILIPTFKI